MFIVNTSFHMLASLEHEFIKWASEVYLPSAEKAGEPLLLKILTDMSPEMAAYCVQLAVENLPDAMDWHDGKGADLRRGLTERFGEKIVFFTTAMEQIAQQ